MEGDKLYRWILISCVLICVLIYLDALAFPLQSRTERVIHISEHRAKGRGASRYLLVTDRAEYRISVWMYENLSLDDPITVYRSRFGRAVQGITVSRDGTTSFYVMGFVRRSLGIFILPLTVLGTLIFGLMFRRIDEGGKQRLTLMFLIVAVIELLAYLDLNIF